MKADKNKDYFYLRAANYCSKAERSPHRVRQKLHEWGADSEWVEQIVDKLEQGNYIDSARYARAFARDKHLLSGWGLQRIRQYLRTERIPQADIEYALEELAEEYQPNNKLQTLLSSKLHSLPNSLDTHRKRERLIRTALYKGYSYGEAKNIIASLLSDTTSDDLEEWLDD